MQIHPTRAAVDVAIAGIVGVGVGLLAQEAAIVAWTGALLIGLAVARSVTQVGIARIRAAGFEMLWRSEPRVRRVARGEEIELEAEVRNRDTRAARYVALRPVASPSLEVRVEPDRGEVAAGGRLAVKIVVRADRIGYHGIHGLSLEVQGGPGLFEVPLTFSNPFGVEVLPRPFAAAMRSPRGGRSRMSADEGRPGPLSGDGMELRELREHQPGDPFKRIAWKASAHRGKLMVRDYEREERDVVWLLLDASVELWSGVLGKAPLDIAADEVAAVAQRHLARGDRVGLAIVGSRVLSWIPPDRGPAHGIALMTSLCQRATTYDGDRSELDETDVALRVLEHMRPLDPTAARGVRPTETERVARRADRVRARAPFPEATAHAQSRQERALRSYLAAFGIASPPRLEPDRGKTDQQLAAALSRAMREKPRPSLVYVWSPAPDLGARPDIERALARHPHRRAELRWVSMRVEPGIPRDGGELMSVVADAVALRARVAEERGEHALRRLGVHVERPRPRAPLRAPM
ncbi:MAG: DUF58 domain-containing protein [Myxococcales bacterium]|nr:DUF58 domain-containing protein [Myxococcales bacterium]MCB9577892.1 DUF58 domain-containing protein [Polyangiaceae bacterium]